MQVYTVATVQRVLVDLMDEAPAIMLFLKSLTRLEVLHWAPDATAPQLLFDCTVQVQALLRFPDLCCASMHARLRFYCDLYCTLHAC